MRVHYLQHEPFEGLGSMADWFAERRAQVAGTHLYRRDPGLPALDSFEWLVVMGGGMSVNDEATLPWLRPEKQLIREAIESGKVVLGVCLGAQLMASALGAPIQRNPAKEIGWWPVARVAGVEAHPLGQVFPARFEAFHWHGETFGVPAGGVLLAHSEACIHQAFAWGDRALALQFHLETTPESAEALIAGSAGDLVPGRYVQQPAQMLERADRFGQLNGLMRLVLETLALKAGH